MKNTANRFGFTVNKDRQIDFDTNNFEITRLVAAAEPSFYLCISCGTCTATCSAANFTDFSLRKMILLIRRGELAGLKEEIEKCMLCGKCQLACPRGVSTRNLVIQINKVMQTVNS